MKNALFSVLAASMLTATALPAQAFVLPVLRVKVMVPVAQPVQQDWRTSDNRFEQRDFQYDGDRRGDYHTDRNGRNARFDRFRKHPLPLPPAYGQASMVSQKHRPPIVFHH